MRGASPGSQQIYLSCSSYGATAVPDAKTGGTLSTKIRIISDRLSSITAGGSPTSASQAAANCGSGMWVSRSSGWDMGSIVELRLLSMDGVRAYPKLRFSTPQPR